MTDFSLPAMTFGAFVATRRPISDELWAKLPEALDILPAREVCFEYADEFLLEEHDGAFWPHAWWYEPIPHDTRESAEKDLWNWRQEFAD